MRQKKQEEKRQKRFGKPGAEVPAGTQPQAEGVSSDVKAVAGSVVKVHYTGRLDDGSVFDSSRERGPLEFTVGAGQMIQGFDRAVSGMSVGESKTVRIPSDEAYGPYKEDLIFEMPKAHFPEGTKEGFAFTLKHPDGSSLEAVVTDIAGDTVTLNANHSLAGKDLIFDIELVEVEID
ncbi:MAG: peptidylprolyl isomerase [Nitrospirae bacterium]|nr:MAG: peptidylprolyl isomerase [Nitrospirota bacterium]